jgi:stearoyl-CoA desaturase (Delta-9 desaturase)
VNHDAGPSTADAAIYTLTGLGVTVGYHRLFTHRSFKTTRPVRALLAVLGSMAVEGPLIEWVATHRKHHRFSDRPGDPHSPHVDHAPGWRGGLRGLAHAHVGWMFRGKDMANPARYAKDLLGDRDLRFISRTFPLWVAVGLAIPFVLGVALTGSVAGLASSIRAAGSSPAWSAAIWPGTSSGSAPNANKPSEDPRPRDSRGC